MASNDTEEQLKNLDKETIIRLFLAQKEQLENLDHTLQLVLEQLADLKRHRFGRSTERHETDGQILFMEIDGNIVFFNEAEAVAADTEEGQDGEAAIMNAKYVNAVPLYRQAQEFARYGLNISRQNMANWTIQCADRYLAIFYDYLHERLYDYHVLQADETPVLVDKNGRDTGSKSYMWVYRTGQMYGDCPIILYKYQKTRNASHPREFLRDFSGVCVTDGYQVYHTIENEREDLKIAGCWSHAR